MVVGRLFCQVGRNKFIYFCQVVVKVFISHNAIYWLTKQLHVLAILLQCQQCSTDWHFSLLSLRIFA